MKHENRIFSVVRHTVGRSKRLSSGLALTIMGTIVLGLLPPLVLEGIINNLVLGEHVLLSSVLLYVLLLSAAGLFDAAKEVLITVFGQRVTRGLRREMCAKLSRLPASYFTNNETGVTVSKFVGDVDTIEALFTAGIISMAVDIIRVLSILAVISVKSKGLGILMVLVLPLLFVMTRMFQKRMLKAQLANRMAVGKVNNHIPETIRNIRMIHTYHKQAYMEKRYDDFIMESYGAMEKSNFYDAVYSPIILTVSAVIVGTMMIMSAMGGGMRSFFGMSVGTAVAVMAYVGKVFEPLESIGMEIQNIQSAAAGMHRINEFLNEDERVISRILMDETLPTENDCPAVEISQVCFGYEAGQPILHEFSLSVRAGEQVTLTGRTGAGKSTIFKLLLGLYSPQSGRVRIYGVDAEQISNKDTRRVFGYVEQSFRLIPGTVEEQITLGDEAISHEATEEAAKLAGIHDSILALERGYETPCAENLFSQGQLQLLAIARAVAGNPAILLLDEITANLDSFTEKQVLDALQKASKHRTVLSISHRLYEYAGGRRVSVDGK